MPKKDKILVEDCPRCSKIPSSVYTDFLPRNGDGGDEIPDELMELPGMSEIDMSSGYQQFKIECDICGTRYLGEIDVEPFLWDFSFKREHNGRATDQFGKVVVLRRASAKTK
ncbi:hypothetical protein HQ524_01445 [Candidatus Uhrbacteria bacterium]|nr:hypothetical protein [Candidatus Uhrbacteria bacterium]